MAVTCSYTILVSCCCTILVTFLVAMFAISRSTTLLTSRRTTSLTYLLHRSGYSFPDGIHDLVLDGDLQSLLHSVAQLFRYGLSDLFNV
jgi:hypothetical protein